MFEKKYLKNLTEKSFCSAAREGDVTLTHVLVLSFLIWIFHQFVFSYLIKFNPDLETLHWIKKNKTIVCRKFFMVFLFVRVDK